MPPANIWQPFRLLGTEGIARRFSIPPLCGCSFAKAIAFDYYNRGETATAYVLDAEEQRRTPLLSFARHGTVQSTPAQAISALVHRGGSYRLGGVCLSSLPPQPNPLSARQPRLRRILSSALPYLSMNRLVAQAASLQYRRLPVGGAWNKTQAPHPASVQQVSNQSCSARKTPAAFCLSLPARNERGESRREGKLIKSASSPRPSPPFVWRRGRANAVARSSKSSAEHYRSVTRSGFAGRLAF